MFEKDQLDVDFKQIYKLVIFIVLVLFVIFQIYVLFEPHDGDPATDFKKLICIFWIIAGVSGAIKLLIDMQLKDRE